MSAPLKGIRTLATRATSSTVVPRTRPLPARKQVLFASHRHLITANPLVLFLRPGDFSATEWRQLRAAIAAIPPSPPKATDAGSSPNTASEDTDAGLKLTVLRPGLLPALLRDPSTSTAVNTSMLATPSHLQGPLAVLTSSSLHPPTLSRVLAILRQFSHAPSPNAPPPDPKAKGKQPVVERMELLSGLFEHTQVANESRTRDVIAKLPALDVLRSQIVGLLGMPGSRITGVLGARAREVGRTVEGFKAGLEGTSSAGGEAGQAAAKAE